MSPDSISEICDTITTVALIIGFCFIVCVLNRPDPIEHSLAEQASDEDQDK